FEVAQTQPVARHSRAQRFDLVYCLNNTVASFSQIILVTLNASDSIKRQCFAFSVIHIAPALECLPVIFKCERRLIHQTVKLTDLVESYRLPAKVFNSVLYLECLVV